MTSVLFLVRDASCLVPFDSLRSHHTDQHDAAKNDEESDRDRRHEEAMTKVHRPHRSGFSFSGRLERVGHQRAESDRCGGELHFHPSCVAYARVLLLLYEAPNVFVAAMTIAGCGRARRSRRTPPGLRPDSFIELNTKPVTAKSNLSRLSETRRYMTVAPELLKQPL